MVVFMPVIRRRWWTGGRKDLGGGGKEKNKYEEERVRWRMRAPAPLPMTGR
jgi:hypothetical protein